MDASQSAINLDIICGVFWFFMLAGGDVGDEVQFLGSAFTIEHTQLIYIFAIVLFLWFFYRYHLVSAKVVPRNGTLAQRNP